MVSVKKLKSFAREEAKSSKEYAKLGFFKQAHDEHEHSEFFKKKLICTKKKRKRKKSIFRRLIESY